MKIWPIITLAGLIWGSFYADGMNTRRESNPHPRPYHSALDAEIAADMKAFDPPHRPVTMAYREFFAHLLADQHDWTAPEGKAATAEAEADADDGEDPGKKLFWHSVFPDSPAIPFPGWGDPNPIPNPDSVSPPFQGDRHVGFEIIFIEDDPTPPKEDENAATIASAKILQLPFGALAALNALAPVGPGEGAFAPCETVLVNGLCTMPCKPNDPLCRDQGKDPVPPVLSDPGGGIPPVVGGGDPPPVIIGGGGLGGVGGHVGNVPEPSTWLLLGLGLAALGWLKRRRFSAVR